MLAANGGVCCLCIDNVSGAYVAGVQQFIRYCIKNIIIHIFQSGSGLNECEQVLAANGGVCCLCIDNVSGAYVAGVQQFIRYCI